MCVEGIIKWCVSHAGDREALVRAQGLGVLACMAGCLDSTKCEGCSTGLRAQVLNIACDTSECYAVRREALLFLSNFVVRCATTPQGNQTDEQDEEQNVPTDTPSELLTHANEVIKMRVFWTFQQSDFTSQLCNLLGDTHASPAFTHAAVWLLFNLACIDSAQVARMLFHEGAWNLLIGLLNLDGYWTKYTNCWNAYWKMAKGGVQSFYL